MSAAVGKATDLQYVGSDVGRVEDYALVTGTAHYIDDIDISGMLHVAFVRSPYAHARIISIATEEAEHLDGVFAVVTGRDLADEVGEIITPSPRIGIEECRRRALPLDKVRHVGEAVVAVVAESRYAAEDGCSLVSVEWEPLRAVVDGEDALAPDAPILDEVLGSNRFAHIEETYGDVESTFAEADVVLGKRFHNGRSTGAPLETKGIVAQYDPGTSEMTVWSSTQSPFKLKALIAAPLRMAERAVRVIVPAIGGAFGIKAHMSVEEVIVPALARQLGRPVKFIEDRYEHMAACAHAKEQIIDLEVAATRDGKILGFRGRYLGDGGAYSASPFTSAFEPLDAAGLIPSIYDVQSTGYELIAAFTNKCMTGTYRGVGWTAGHTARESLVDDLGRYLGIDPVELRLLNCIPSTPFTSVTGMHYDGGSYAESIRAAMDAIDYSEFRKRQGALREAERYIGIGFSPYVEPTAFGSKIAEASGTPSAYYDSVNITVGPDGGVTVRAGFSASGQGHATSLSQVAADALGARFDDVRLVQDDTAAGTFCMGTSASRTAVIGGGAIRRAASEVREKLKSIAAHMLEASVEDIVIRDGKGAVRGAPTKHKTFAEIARFAYFDPASRRADLDLSLSATKMYDPEETYSNGTIVAAVEVDIETGIVTIDRIVSVGDCGVVINPMIVRGQYAGAIAQGIGAALYESLEYDDEGQFLSGTLMDYLYPSSSEVPMIEMLQIETPSPVTEGGMKGMAEAGIIAGPAAVVNAIADALSPFNIEVNHTPVRPGDILELVDG